MKDLIKGLSEKVGLGSPELSKAPSETGGMAGKGNEQRAGSMEMAEVLDEELLDNVDEVEEIADLDEEEYIEDGDEEDGEGIGHDMSGNVEHRFEEEEEQKENEQLGLPVGSLGQEYSIEADSKIKFENDFGIVDTIGNILEWTNDSFDSTSKKNHGAKYRAVRGGSWISGNDIRLFSRFMMEPESHSNILGFRCVAY